jgi:hypothetical protein
MKSKMILTGLIFSIALALYVDAQSEPTQEQGVGSYYYARGQAGKAPVTLCTGPIMATEGTAKCLYQALPVSGRLHIEMQDGSIQEIDLKTVKKMTVSDR